jgi:hypothetical protein
MFRGFGTSPTWSRLLLRRYRRRARLLPQHTLGHAPPHQTSSSPSIWHSSHTQRPSALASHGRYMPSARCTHYFPGTDLCRLARVECWLGKREQLASTWLFNTWDGSTAFLTLLNALFVVTRHSLWAHPAHSSIESSSPTDLGAGFYLRASGTASG